MDRERAMALRLKGFSYTEIQRIHGIPKSTLSTWFNGLLLSDSARARLKSRVKEGLFNGLVKRNRLQTHEARQRAKRTQDMASVGVGNISPRELMLIGTTLYWAEGYKRLQVKNGKEKMAHYIGMTNTDPILINVFIKFLNEILGIEKSKIRINVRLFKHINEKTALAYWQLVTGLDLNNFEKVTYVISRSSLGKKPFNRLPYGTAQVRVSDTPKFHHIIGLIQGIKRFCMTDD